MDIHLCLVRWMQLIAALVWGTGVVPSPAAGLAYLHRPTPESAVEVVSCSLGALQPPPREQWRRGFCSQPFQRAAR